MKYFYKNKYKALFEKLISLWIKTKIPLSNKFTVHINWAVTVVIIYYLPKKYVQHYKRNQNTCTRQLPSSGPSVGEEKQSQ